MEDWLRYYNEANSYAKAAFGSYKNSRLGNQVVYNLIGLSLENYLTALCMKLDVLPVHSSIGSMLSLLGRKMPVPEKFKEESRFINRFMNFCSLEIFEPKEPTKEDLERMLIFTTDIHKFCSNILFPKKKSA